VILTYRRPLVGGVYLALWTLSFLGALVLRFDFDLPVQYAHMLWAWLPAILIVRTAAYMYFGLFRGMWRYAGGHELFSLIKAATASSVLFVLFNLFGGFHGFPRSVLIIDWILNIILVGGLRFSFRALMDLSAQVAVKGERKKVLIVGAGDAGETLVREMQKNRGAYAPVGFVDDNKHKLNDHIHGVRVLGPISAVPALVAAHGVDEVIIAIPSASGREVRAIVETCAPSGVKVRTIPSVESLIEGRVTVNQIRSVAIEDLLRREPVKLEAETIGAAVRGHVVVVTGAGGSIGSELCRQICQFAPSRLVLVEQAENNLFNIHRELRDRFPDVASVPVIADVCDARRMESTFDQHRPTVVFHAAAHKHVPMMEWNPGEAVKNNVLGTKGVADLADAHGVERFVMISTDKAVNPTSVMGVSKRLAEAYVQTLGQRSRTRFVTVRFGNVLGSAGSVIPIFQEQIAKGGPVTVTHPEMKRYFMTIPEACQLVLQAGAMGAGGEIFVLDMGEPVKIVDLARDLIRLSGFRPDDDVEIRFTGVRPGEKLFEEIATADERADKTRHPKIFVGRSRPYTWRELVRVMDELAVVAENTDPAAVRARLQQAVPEYQPALPAEASAPAVAGPRQRISTVRNVIPLKR
jgi:FlaA1/EpsC-like NDP-sugar epimerase